MRSRVRLLLICPPVWPAFSTCCCAGGEPSLGRPDIGWDDLASSLPYRCRKQQCVYVKRTIPLTFWPVSYSEPQVVHLFLIFLFICEMLNKRLRYSNKLDKSEHIMCQTFSCYRQHKVAGQQFGVRKNQSSKVLCSCRLEGQTLVT